MFSSFSAVPILPQTHTHAYSTHATDVLLEPTMFLEKLRSLPAITDPRRWWLDECCVTGGSNESVLPSTPSSAIGASDGVNDSLMVTLTLRAARHYKLLMQLRLQCANNRSPPELHTARNTRSICYGRPTLASLSQAETRLIDSM